MLIVAVIVILNVTPAVNLSEDWTVRASVVRVC